MAGGEAKNHSSDKKVIKQKKYKIEIKMEAVLEKKKSFRPTLNPIQESETLTYEILQQYKGEQEQLIAAGIIEKPKITDDVFTPKQEREFNRGRSVEEVFDDIAKKYGF